MLFQLSYRSIYNYNTVHNGNVMFMGHNSNSFGIIIMLNQKDKFHVKDILTPGDCPRLYMCAPLSLRSTFSAPLSSPTLAPTHVRLSSLSGLSHYRLLSSRHCQFPLPWQQDNKSLQRTISLVHLLLMSLIQA